MWCSLASSMMASEVSAPITVKSALREDQLAAIDALADALAADVKG